MITKNMIDEAMKDLSEMAKCVYGKKLKGVILFGSCARGEFDQESDIDFMVLLDVPAESINEERDLLDPVIWELDEKYDYELLFSPIVKSYDEFLKWTNIIPFYSNVNNEGVRYV